MGAMQEVLSPQCSRSVNEDGDHNYDRDALERENLSLKPWMLDILSKF